MKANIYTIEPLPAAKREAIHDGIGMVAAYMGETVVASELRIRVPIRENGTVDPARIGFGKLDPLTELHLMAVPLNRGEDNTLGVAAINTGYAFIDTNRDYDPLTLLTAAHETAHAMGFVSNDADHADPTSSHHCQDECCVMNKRVLIDVLHKTTVLEQTRMQKLLKKPLQFSTTETTTIMSQHDFCLCCKVDMRSKSARNLSRLRHNRMFPNQVITFRESTAQ